MMKTTEHFKKVIQDYLTQRAASDDLFAVSFAKPAKNIDDCVTYILETVYKTGCNGFIHDEIYSIAVHFYDENNIKTGQPIECQVVINHTIELTEQEKEQARKDAVQKAQEEAYAKMKQVKIKPSAKRTEDVKQNSLFDL